MKNKKFKSLQTKIVSITLAVGIMSILIAMAFVYFIGNRTIERIIGANFKELAFETSERADSYIEHHLEESRFLAMSSEILSILREREKLYSKRDPFEIQYEVEKIEERWENILPSEPVLANILNNKATDFLRKFNVKDWEEEPVHYMLLITDSRGVAVASVNKPEKYLYSKEDWWKKAYNSDRRVYIPDITFNKSINGFSFDIITPISDNGKIIGIILMVHEVKRFFKTVTSVKVGETDHTMLVSSDGVVQFCPILPIKSHSLTEELTKVVFKDKPGWVTTYADLHHYGERSLVGHSPVSLSLSLGKPNFGGNKWYIISSQDPEETYAPIHTLINWVAVLGVLSVGLLCFLEISALRKIIRPIKMLKEGAELIGEGNLTHRLEIDSRDEVEEVAVKFNEMAAKLKSSYDALEQKSHEVSETNKDLAILYDTTSTMSQSLQINDILGEVLNKILQSMGWDIALIYLLDGDSEKLLLSSQGGLKVEIAEKDTTVSINTLPYSQVVQKGESFVSENIVTDNRLEQTWDFAEKFEALACVPLMSKNVVLGALTIFCADSKNFTKKSINLLESIGNQLGMNIENARLYDETKRLNQMKSEFVFHVSHELRTPLASIKSAAEALLFYEQDDKKLQNEFLEAITSETSRLTKLINEILNLSRIESGQIKWNFESVNIEEIIVNTIQVVKALARFKKVKLKTSIPENLPTIKGDKDKLLEVMNNLLDNALKFTDKGDITVGVEPTESNMLRVYVADTGRGIPEDDKEKIFEPFYQSGNMLKDKPRGTGLGLNICKKIIERHTGEIWVESELGKGSTIFFTLPISEENYINGSINKGVKSTVD